MIALVSSYAVDLLVLGDFMMSPEFACRELKLAWDSTMAKKEVVAFGWTNISAWKIGLRPDLTPDGIICLPLFIFFKMTSVLFRDRRTTK